jgi:hypothetical protein
MSTKITTEVWEHSSAKDSALLLLLALADHADSVHAQCWPSVARLARMIRKSERNTRYLLRKLEEGSHIAVKFKGSAHQTNVYQILRPWAMGQELLQEHKCAGATHCPTNGARAVAPDPKAEPKPEEREKTRAREEGGKPQVTKVTEEEVASWLTPGSALWYFVQGLTPPGGEGEASLQGNGHRQDGRAKTNGLAGRPPYANGTYPYSGR